MFDIYTTHPFSFPEYPWAFCEDDSNGELLKSLTLEMVELRSVQGAEYISCVKSELIWKLKSDDYCSR